MTICPLQGLSGVERRNAYVYWIENIHKRVTASSYTISNDETGENDENITGFEILTEVTVFLGVTPCSSVRHWRFGGTYCHYLHNRSVSQESKHQEGDSLFRLLFDPEDEDGTFFRNVCELLLDNTVPRLISPSRLEPITSIKTTHFDVRRSSPWTRNPPSPWTTLCVWSGARHILSSYYCELIALIVFGEEF
jgi:hypothetical protein